MLSYHGDPAIKAKYLARVREHARLDRLVQRTGWKKGKGCAVGCTLEAYDHSRYPIELGLPEWLAHLEDTIFEGLPWEHARTWPERFLEAIPVGWDLEPVRWQQAIWRHMLALKRLKDNAEPYAQQVRDAIKGVIDYCQGMIAGTATDEQRSSARESAWSAAVSAARSAEAAAEAAAWSAWSAAESARLAHYIAESEHLLKLLADSGAKSAA